MVQYLELDSTEVDGKSFTFLESSAKFQKTGTSALKISMEMPLVAPVLGCTEVAWCHKWIEVIMAHALLDQYVGLLVGIAISAAGRSHHQRCQNF